MGNARSSLVDSRGVFALFGGSRREARNRLVLWMGARSELTSMSDAGADEPWGPVRTRDVRPNPDAELGRLIQRMCVAGGILEPDLRSASRTRAVAEVRAEVVYRASVELGIPGAVIARTLDISEGAVTRARLRGQVLVSRKARPEGEK
jgi:hypothetical protein